mmetsp:Transcript_42772/g.77716  ORF Transcript_42772/g.77716 Transcript_42772/m.77716 type:complete len:275 (-) Transcript_42772:180-1004(-)
MAGTWRAPSITPAALSSPRKSTKMPVFSFSIFCTASGSMCAMVSKVATRFGHSGGVYFFFCTTFLGAVEATLESLVVGLIFLEPARLSRSCTPLAVRAAGAMVLLAPGVEVDPRLAPFFMILTSLTKSVPSFMANLSRSLEASVSAKSLTGKPWDSQPRKPPERMATFCFELVFWRYQLAHCGARCAEYWHMNITISLSCHCLTSSGTRAGKVTFPSGKAGTCTAPSMTPAALSSPRTSTSTQLVLSRSLWTSLGSKCSTLSTVGTRLGQCGGT